MSSDNMNASWMERYAKSLDRTDASALKKPAGPHCCAICCTFFSAFAALFLFVVSGLLGGHYRYIHMAGDMEEMGKSVSGAAIAYVVIALISVAFWVRGAMRAKAAAREQEEATAALASADGVASPQ